MDAIWEGDAVPLGDLVPGVPPEVDVRVLVWCEVGTEQLLATGMVGPDQLPGAFVDLFFQAMREPMHGPPRRPRTLRLVDPLLAAAVKARTEGLELDVVQVDQLETAGRQARGLGLYLAVRHPARSYVQGGRVDPGVVARFFEAAAAYYRAAPWRALVERQVLRLELEDGEEPVYATVMGASQEVYGLVLYLSGGPAALFTEGAPIDVLGLTFESERDAPLRMLEERRLHRWRVAGPSAFPLAVRRTAEQEAGDANAAELELLTAALRACARFANRHRRALRRSQAVAERVELPGNVAHPAMDVSYDPDLLYPAERAPQLMMPEVPAPAQRGSRPALYQELAELASRLPECKSIVRRLGWTFNRAPEPRHMRDMPDMHEAILPRFLEWAFFVARPGERPTLAERALEHVPGASEKHLEALRRFARARYSIYAITRVRPDYGFELEDRVTHERIRLREPGLTRLLRAGFDIFGALFPVGPEEYVVGDGVTPFPEAFPIPEEGRVAAHMIAPQIEQLLYGASPDWIDTLDGEDVRSAYDQFHDDMAGAGNELPEFEELVQRIADSSQGDVTAPYLTPGRWWSVEEALIFTRLVEQISLVTPRAELEGRAPADVLTAGGVGPQTQQLIRELIREVAERVEDENPGSPEERRLLQTRIAQELLETRDEELRKSLEAPRLRSHDKA
ncbi:MAG: hypothetical protein HY703_12545 [Gemmatimonadetes bacterium]|nr:hypothetical protein [Gemmatimonadota bacterium]